MAQDMAKEWQTVAKACQTLGVSQRTLYRRIKSGEIESKVENKRRYVLVTVAEVDLPVADIVASTELVQELRSEIEHLKQELERRNEQITGLQEQLKEASHRHDTVVLQMTRLLEYHQQPFWRKLFSRKALPPPEKIMDMESEDR